MDSAFAAAVRRRLEEVLDPELDESIVSLGFVRGLELKDSVLTVTLKLPTFWCAPNFAFIMAEDVRRALSTLDGVREVRVALEDHFAAEEVCGGVNLGKSFPETFPGEAESDLDALRDLFRRKGFIRRQEQAIRTLADAGLSFGQICALRLADLQLAGDRFIVAGEGGSVSVPAEPITRYLKRRSEFGLDASPEGPLFVDLSGRPFTPEGLAAYLRRARLVRTSLEANVFLCRALLAARNATEGGGQNVPHG
ncbi:MAG: metal-sulfur cluster biosynthetic enzyme [Chloroflexota bacterium]